MSDLIEDLKQAAARLTCVKPQVVVSALGDGTYTASLVLALGTSEGTPDTAIAALARMVASMLESNVDHDRVFQQRLAEAAAAAQAEPR